MDMPLQRVDVQAFRKCSLLSQWGQYGLGGVLWWCRPFCGALVIISSEKECCRLLLLFVKETLVLIR